MKFELTGTEIARVDEWLETVVYPIMIAEQKQRHEESGTKPSAIMASCWEMGFPYSGAIGGALTYCFSPTSIGMVTIVKCGDMELNLTDYGSW
jgi:hypothetical protein